MGLTKAQLEALNITSFPDNTTGLITPAILRGYNTASIENTVNQDVYTTDSASVKVSITNLNASSASQQISINALNGATSSYVTSAITASSLVTASVNTNTITFTKGNGTTFDIVVVASGSVAPGTISGSAQITALGFVSSSVTASSLVTASFSGNTLTFTKGNGTTFGVVIPDVSGSTINTGSFATTGSNTFRGTQTIQTGNLVMGNGFTIAAPSGDITNLSAGTSIQFITEPPTGPGGTNDIKFINRVSGSSIIFENTQGGVGNRIDLTGGEIRLFANAASGSNGEITIGSNTRVINASSTPIIAAAVTASALLVNGNQKIVGNQFITGAILQSGSLLNELTKVQIAKSNKADFSEANTLLSLVGDTEVIFDQYVDGGNYDTVNIRIVQNSGSQFRDYDSTINWVPWLTVPTNTGNNPSPIFTRGLQITGSLGISGNITASLQQGFTYVGNSAGRTTTVSTASFVSSNLTASFATTGSNTFRGNQTITGSVLVSGSVTQTINAPANGTQTDFIVVKNATPSGKPYSYQNFNLQNLPVFGPDYEDAFILEAYDSSGYNYGSELVLNGLGLVTTITPSGSVFGVNSGILRIKDTENQKSIAVLDASVVELGAGASTTDSVKIGKSTLPYLQLSSLSNQITGSTIISGSNGLRVIGNQTITGSLILSSSAAVELTVIGNAVITGSLLVSGSLGITGTTTVNGSLILSGSGASAQFPTFDATSGRIRYNLAFTGSRFASEISTSLEIENLTAYQFGFNQNDKTDFNTGAQFIAETNKDSGYTEFKLNARYTGSSDAQIRIRNTAGVRTFTVDADNSTFNGNVKVASTFQLQLPVGSNQQAGTAVLNGGNPGTVTVSNSLVTANSIIMVSKQTLAHPNGYVAVSAKGSGTFTITSNHNGDADTVGWFIINNS